MSFPMKIKAKQSYDRHPARKSMVYGLKDNPLGSNEGYKQEKK